MSATFVHSVLDSSLVIPDLRLRRRDSALGEMVAFAERRGVVRDAALVRDVALLRERIGTSNAGKGVALPAARSLGVIDARLVLARAPKGIEWSGDEPVQLVVLTLSPAEAGEEAHHELMARAAAAVRLQRTRQRLLEAAEADALAALLREAALA